MMLRYGNLFVRHRQLADILWTCLRAVSTTVRLKNQNSYNSRFLNWNLPYLAWKLLTHLQFFRSWMDVSVVHFIRIRVLSSCNISRQRCSLCHSCSTLISMSPFGCVTNSSSNHRWRAESSPRLEPPLTFPSPIPIEGKKKKKWKTRETKQTREDFSFLFFCFKKESF